MSLNEGIETKPESRPQSCNRRHNLLLLTKVLTDFCSPDHKLADTLKLVAKIFFYRNSISPAASFLSSTRAHEQFQILPLSCQAQI